MSSTHPRDGSSGYFPAATYLVATLLALLPFALWQLARGSGAVAQIKRPRPG